MPRYALFLYCISGQCLHRHAARSAADKLYITVDLAGRALEADDQPAVW